MTFIETGIALAAVAKAMRTTVARVEAEARALSLFIGVDWSGQPALSVIDARALASGEARRQQEHDVAWRAHLTRSEEWEAEREAARSGAFQSAHDTALRAGRGAPAAAAAGHEAARQAVGAYERRTSPPEFMGKATATRWLSRTADKVRELI